MRFCAKTAAACAAHVRAADKALSVRALIVAADALLPRSRLYARRVSINIAPVMEAEEEEEKMRRQCIEARGAE